MELQKAIDLCDELIRDGKGPIGQHFQIWTVCGSIRRQRENVNDIDIVAILKKHTQYTFGSETLEDSIHRLSDQNKELAKSDLSGNAIKRFHYKGIMIDLYIADESTYQTLVLIRTGSKDFNVRLTTIAKGLGMKLHASGKGLCRIDKDGNDIEIISNTERGIIERLIGKEIPPEKRF